MSRVLLVVSACLLAGCTSGTGLQQVAATGSGSAGSSETPSPTPGSLETRTNSMGMKLVKVPAGSFTMGDPRRQLNATPPHAVSVSSFWIGQYEVTNSEFNRFMKLPPAPVSPGPRHPVGNVSWLEADRFCQWLSRREHRSYRLPTEAEWEYAARGGLAGKDYPWGDAAPNGRAQVAALGTAPVGSFPPNGFGLYDMAGNVQEFVNDWYEDGYYANSPKVDPRGPATPPGRMKVFRDGPFGAWEPYCAIRLPTGRYHRYEHQGFRVVMEVAKTSPANPLASPVPPPPAETAIKDPVIAAAQQRSVDEAMVLAISRFDRQAARILLKQGAKVDLRGFEDATVLHVAVSGNDTGMITTILACGASIEAQDVRGDTPLIDAAHFADPDVAELLLKRGAKVNHANAEGVTPLMWAANAGNGPMVRMLLKHGADPKLVDAEGRTARWYAQKLGNPETLQLLPK